MRYMTVAEASRKWNVTRRQVQRLVAHNRIPGAQKFGRAWMLPSDMEKPADLRREKAVQKSLSSDLLEVLSATTIPMPAHNPDAILDTLPAARLRLIYEAELAYLRGDFRRTMQCYLQTAGDDAARLRACPAAIAAAISLGDYQVYTEIDSYLKKCVEAYKGSSIAAFAELGLATAAVSMIAPQMAPGWLQEGDISALAPPVRPKALYFRAKYFHCLGQYELALAVAQSALALCAPERGITVPDLYLRVTCAVACYYLGRVAEARRWLLETMRLALPHGLITPFAELVTALGGLVEQCLEQEFPDRYSAVMEQWKRTWKNWITFHNQFTNDHITLKLSLREYHIALLVARRVPYAKIAEQYGISVGRLKNIVLEIYEKLFISGRNELARHVF